MVSHLITGNVNGREKSLKKWWDVGFQIQGRFLHVFFLRAYRPRNGGVHFTRVES